MESHLLVAALCFSSTLFALADSSLSCPPSPAGHTFSVGGNGGWSLQPCDGLNRWAQGLRFHVNDTLVFKYKEGEDSVLLVEKWDYYHCVKTRPIQTLITTSSGNSSTFTLTRSGQFYFISGHADNCAKGQRLSVVVMSPDHHYSNPSSAPSPARILPSENVPSPSAPPSGSPSPAPAQKAKSGAVAVGGRSFPAVGMVVVAGIAVMLMF
ncbi:hypothetical protein DM860_003809 [Cuscuta australis]|uniref:Phytocyanin domain-containing protein n=1 Tax=Cuscuta australis TaxID=267555 RepID=A0A328DIL4_9ASTE|nr:hypothetical protein DM860_003809 [Cuscuta australis]